MKKRLLSAALALAMVLTLLPVSVFATIAPAGTDGAKATKDAPASGYTTVQYVPKNDFSKKDISDNPVQGWAWQWTDTSVTPNKTYWATDANLSGIVSGTSASGTYYADMTDFTNTAANGTKSLRSTSFTLLGDAAVPADVLTVGASLQVNVFGNNLTFGTGAPEKLNSLTVTDTAYTQYGESRGSVTIARNVASYTAPAAGVTPTMSTSGLTLNVTGATVTSLSLQGRGNRVTLTDVNITGGITLSGATDATNTNSTHTYTYDTQTLSISPKAAAPYTKSTITGNITVTGNNSSVTLNGVTGSGTVTVTGVGGTVTAGNGTSLGTVTVATGTAAATNPTLTKASNPASVTINDATVGGISYTKADTDYTGASTFTVNAQGKATGEIKTDNGTVNLHSANVANVTVAQGTLNIDGTNGVVNNIVLGSASTASSTTLNFSGTYYTVGDITNSAKNTLTIGNNWPTGRSNTFGTLTDNNSSKYAGHGIKGGVFKTAATTTALAGWFSTDLQFMRQVDATYYAYYGKQELSTAIADADTDPTSSYTAAKADVLSIIGDQANKKYVGFYNTSTDSNPVALLAYGELTAIYLPDMINGTGVATWTATTDNVGTAKTYGINELVALSVNNLAVGAGTATKPVQFVIQASSASVTKLTNAATAATGGNNANVTTTLSGSTITLSGAVNQSAYDGIVITLTTDMKTPTGTFTTFNVEVAYNPDTKEATFTSAGVGTVPQGVTINSTTIVVGANTYTLNVSGLAKPAGSLMVAGLTDGPNKNTTSLTGKTIVATVNVSGMGNSAKTELVDAIQGTGSTFDWTDSPAMQQSVNQALATITNETTLNTWRTAAQRAAWNLNNQGKTPTEADLTPTGYDTVVLEPYLAVNVTGYNQSGTMTATLVPSYRVLVVSSDTTYVNLAKGKTGFTADGYYIAQTGRALPQPISDLTDGVGDKGVVVTFGSTVATSFQGTVMHQDSTYAYKAAAGATSWTLTRAGKTGLGTVVINKIEPLVTLVRQTGASNVVNGKIGTYYYDNLQAAIDDTLPQPDTKEDKVTVTAAYTGSGVINVSGLARKFTVVTEGNTKITNANNNFTVGVDTTGHNYTVQLQQDAAAPGQNIVVASATGGSATVSANPATAGSTVTVTLSPATGYVSQGVAVRTNTGTTVTASGSGNTYTFTMPANVTTVTVTPTFAVGDNKAVFAVNSSIQGTAAALTGTSDGKAEQGATVPVAVSPKSGYRTIGLTARGNNGTTASVTRTGTNNFNVTVPSGATTVTVTPSFDVDTGTPFIDVLSNHWASSYVTWAYNNKYIEGTGTYTYSPSSYMTLGEVVAMLYKAAGSPPITGMRNPYSNLTPTSHWAYNAIIWAANQGLISSSTGTINPWGNATRAEIVEILYRRAGNPPVYGSSGFTDVASNASYARAVTWARQQGLSNGYGSNSIFRPGYAVSRAEMAAFLQRAFSK